MCDLKKKTSLYPQLIAHRGAGLDAPENTLAAFQLGAKSGYRMFECDVKLSQDKELFLLHDTTLERTTNLTGEAKEHSWAQLKTADAGSWHSALYQGEKLLHFGELVSFVLAQQYGLDIEIKPNKGEAYETGAAVANYLQQSVGEFPADQSRFFLSSFEPEALRGAKEAFPEIPRALLVDVWPKEMPEFWALLDTLDCRGIITNYRIITPEILQQAHDSGRFVMVYTANEIVNIERLLKMGVDSVITDNMTAINTL